MKMEQQNTNSKEGVEVLQQVPFEDEKLGKGQYTSKNYHLQRLVCSVPVLLMDFRSLIQSGNIKLFQKIC
jgi:hypothetical protein